MKNKKEFTNEAFDGKQSHVSFTQKLEYMRFKENKQ